MGIQLGGIHRAAGVAVLFGVQRGPPAGPWLGGPLPVRCGGDREVAAGQVSPAGAAPGCGCPRCWGDCRHWNKN